MTLEISEIAVRLAVGSPPEPGPSTPPATEDEAAGAMTPAEDETLISTSVERVLQSLRRIEER